MHLRLRVGNHPLHPALTDFPIALLPLAFVWYLIALWQGGDFWWQAAFWTLVAGLVAALPTAVTGFLDYLNIARNGQVFKTATNHMLIMLTAVFLFAGSAIAQGGSSGVTGGQAALVVGLAAAGTLLIAAGGWLGGELVFRHGVGVDSRESEHVPVSVTPPINASAVPGAYDEASSPSAASGNYTTGLPALSEKHRHDNAPF